MKTVRLMTVLAMTLLMLCTAANHRADTSDVYLGFVLSGK